MSIKCKVCGHGNPAENRYCLNCGSPIEADAGKMSQAIDDISEARTILLDPKVMQQRLVEEEEKRRREREGLGALPAAGGPSMPPPPPMKVPPPFAGTPPGVVPPQGPPQGQGMPASPPETAPRMPPQPAASMPGGWPSPPPPPAPPAPRPASPPRAVPQSPRQMASPSPSPRGMSPQDAPAPGRPAQPPHSPPAGYGRAGGQSFPGGAGVLPVAHEAELAGIGARFVALIIDWIVLGLVYFVLNVMGLGRFPVILYGFFTLIWAGYVTCFLGFRGQTPGKMLMGVKVVGLEGQKIGYGVALQRWLGHLVDFLLCIVGGYLFGVFRPDRRALHDLIASTKVVAVRK